MRAVLLWSNWALWVLSELRIAMHNVLRLSGRDNRVVWGTAVLFRRGRRIDSYLIDKFANIHVSHEAERSFNNGWAVGNSGRSVLHDVQVWNAKGAAQVVPEDSAELKQRQAERNHQRNKAAHAGRHQGGRWGGREGGDHVRCVREQQAHMV